MKVLSKAGVREIKIENVSPTLEYVAELIGIPINELVILGSAGKVFRSGDIDIAVEYPRFVPAAVAGMVTYDAEDIHNRLVEVLGADRCYYNPGLMVGSYAFPIVGDTEDGLVQVDLMYVRNTKWAEFAYFSPGINSWYKGAVRAILLSAVAGTINEPGIDAFEYDEEGEMLVRAGWGLDLNVGLKRMYQMRKISKRTGAWLKTMENVSPEAILDKFPTLKFDAEQWVLDDPDLVVKKLFGDDIKVSDVESAEDIMWLIFEAGLFSQERIDNIIKVAKKRAQPLIEKMELPFELK